MIREQDLKLSQINREYEDVLQKHQDLLRESKVRTTGLTHDAESRDECIQLLKSELDKQEESNHVLAETYDELKTRNEELAEELSIKNGEKKKLKKKMNTLEKKVHEFVLHRKSEGTAELELAALQKDKERLIQIL